MKWEEFNDYIKEKGITLGSVESFTGGLFASSIISISGASSFFKGAIVTYATEEKIKLLNIKEDRVNKYGVVSKQIAFDMAKFGREKLNVDYCVSFTGNAGPDAMEGKAAGEIYIGISSRDKVTVKKYNLKGDRKKIQKRATVLAAKKLIKILEKENLSEKINKTQVYISRGTL